MPAWQGSATRAEVDPNSHHLEATMFCRSQSIVAESNVGAIGTAIKCRSWLCEHCQPMRHAQLVRFAFSGEPNRFITITCRRGQFATPEIAAAALSSAWRTVVLRWRRSRKGNQCEYLCVFEATKLGWPHLHILWRGDWIQWHWLKAQMTALLNSPSVLIKAMSTTNSYAVYVTKYVGKEPHRFGTTKRYWASQKYEISKPTDARKVFPKIGPENRRNETIEAVVHDWTRHHRLIWQLSSGIYGWGDPWWDRSRPPVIPLTRIEEIEGKLRHILVLPPDFDPRAERAGGTLRAPPRPVERGEAGATV